MLLAAQSMAVGTVLMPWVSKFCDPVMATGWHMVLGGLPLAALSAWQETDSLQARLPQLTGAACVPAEKSIRSLQTADCSVPCLLQPCIPLQALCQPCRI